MSLPHIRAVFQPATVACRSCGCPISHSVHAAASQYTADPRRSSLQAGHGQQFVTYDSTAAAAAVSTATVYRYYPQDHIHPRRRYRHAKLPASWQWCWWWLATLTIDWDEAGSVHSNQCTPSANHANTDFGESSRSYFARAQWCCRFQQIRWAQNYASLDPCGYK